MTGFENEREIILALNGKNFADLNANLQKMILKINNGQTPTSITAKKYAGKDKADLSVTLDGKESKISVKKGDGNSVHQEPVEEFITFLTGIENDQTIFNDMRHIIWGDETFDGTGNIKDRINIYDYRRKYPNKIISVQTYLEKHKDVLIRRFLVSGSVSINQSDYLYHGTVKEGTICKTGDFLKYVSNNKPPRAVMNVGILSFQTWNRNLKGGNKSEHKRKSNEIQLKWGTLETDIKKI